jgi:hypothetical protein
VKYFSLAKQAASPQSNRDTRNFISGIGRENHAMMLDHHSQTKNPLVSYSTKPLGLF